MRKTTFSQFSRTNWANIKLREFNQEYPVNSATDNSVDLIPWNNELTQTKLEETFDTQLRIQKVSETWGLHFGKKLITNFLD